MMLKITALAALVVLAQLANSNPTAPGCACKHLLNPQGKGNCGKGWCYVEQPSDCSDVKDGEFIPGEKFSNEACELLPYELLGCFKDSIPRALDSLEGMQNLKSILTDHYTRRTDAVTKCYEATNKLGYHYFAVQDGGQCFSSFNLLHSSIEKEYSKYGSSSDCGSDGEGGPMANSVYKIKTE